MRRLFVICTVLAAIATTTVSFAQNAKPFVIPELKEWKGAEGQLSPSGRIIAELPCADVANALAEDYNAMFGKHLTVIPKAKAQKGDIVLKLASKKKNDNPENYNVNIGDNIEVTSTSPQGLYWATRTLLQIAEATDGTCSYDQNGNMTANHRKGISSIAYNPLNLPWRIQFTNGNTIHLTYDMAGGEKRVVYTTMPSTGVQPVTTTLDYCGSLVFQDYSQKYIRLEDDGIWSSSGKPAGIVTSPPGPVYLVIRLRLSTV